MSCEATNGSALDDGHRREHTFNSLRHVVHYVDDTAHPEDALCVLKIPLTTVLRLHWSRNTVVKGRISGWPCKAIAWSCWHRWCQHSHWFPTQQPPLRWWHKQFFRIVCCCVGQEFFLSSAPTELTIESHRSSATLKCGWGTKEFLVYWGVKNNRQSAFNECLRTIVRCSWKILNLSRTTLLPSTPLLRSFLRLLAIVRMSELPSLKESMF